MARLKPVRLEVTVIVPIDQEVPTTKEPEAVWIFEADGFKMFTFVVVTAKDVQVLIDELRKAGCGVIDTSTL